MMWQLQKKEGVEFFLHQHHLEDVLRLHRNRETLAPADAYSRRLTVVVAADASTADGVSRWTANDFGLVSTTGGGRLGPVPKGCIGVVIASPTASCCLIL